MTEIKLIFFIASCVVSFYAGVVLSKPKQPIIIYQVDNAGAEMHGYITNKEIIDGRYTVTAGAYGKFLVSAEQYDQIEIGDEVPDYLKGRGK
ncbi:hypothetical protein RN86_10070 [Streptococcus gordonii]|uniref:DUF1372 family protein n=1 Tax=Streptococcus gordonii TaxID=1302 RepID=UPI0006B24591|nr:DUF1372 family protein [Streptococcus gordonii]ALD72737.1 hypothetical protein RN86_10070 [Streptococcus gordonii]